MRIVMPQPWLRHAINELMRTPEHTLTWAFSLRRTAQDGAILLVRRDDRTFPEKPDGPLRLQLVEHLPAPDAARPNVPLGECWFWLAPNGHWRAWWQPRPRAGFHLPQHGGVELSLPGPQLLHLTASAPIPTSPARPIATRESWRVVAQAWQSDPTAHSRTAGALGWPAVWGLREQDYALVGAGRNGSALAAMLAAYQPRSLTLIDPDRVEPGNLDGLVGAGHADATESATSKVAALSRWLHQTVPGSITRIHPLAQSVLGQDAQAALACCDVLVSAVDNDAARLSASVASSIGHHIHLDVGSGIQRTTDGYTLGADVRLILPGEQRCLCCLGGFARPDDLAALNRPLRTDQGDWQENKAGSLTSFSHLVAGLAIRLLEDLAAGHIQHSTWLRVLQMPNAIFPTIRQLDAPTDPNCPVCNLAGQGTFHAPYLSQLAAAVVARQQRQVS